MLPVKTLELVKAAHGLCLWTVQAYKLMICWFIPAITMVNHPELARATHGFCLLSMKTYKMYRLMPTKSIISTLELDKYNCELRAVR